MGKLVAIHSPERSANTQQSKPLEAQIKEYLDLMPSTHAETTAFMERPKSESSTKATASTTSSSASAAVSGGSTTQTLVESMAATSLSKCTPVSLLETMSLLNLQLQLLSTAREDWWDSPAKKKQRREWQEACDQKKLTGLQVVNQKTRDMLAGMEALLGRFVRWTLGAQEGLDGLDAAVEEAKKGEKK